MSRILSIGADRPLLKSRDAVLSAAGYEVLTADTAERAARLVVEEDFDLLVICHSFSEPERERLVRLLKSVKPSVPALHVSRKGEAQIALADEVVDGLAGPGELLQKVSALLAAKAHCPPAAAR